jgi:hypothetical protein
MRGGMLPRSDRGVPLLFERKGGTQVKGLCFAARFRQPNDSVQENGTYGG